MLSYIGFSYIGIADYTFFYVMPLENEVCFNKCLCISQFLLNFSIFCCQMRQLKRQHSVFQTIPRVYNISLYHFLISGFVSHQAIARTAGNVLIQLADSLVLPLNCSDYAESLEDFLNTTVTLYEHQLHARNISMGNHKTVRDFHVSNGALNVMCGYAFDLCVCILGQGCWNNHLTLLHYL